MKIKARILINYMFLILHKAYCFLLSFKFIFYNFRVLTKGDVVIVSKLAELGDIIACTAIFDYLSDDIKGKTVFYVISTRIELDFDKNVKHFKFKKEVAQSYYHWLLLRKMVTFFKKNRIIDLNLNGAWCHKTNKKYFLNDTGINENNYYHYGGLFASAFNIPYYIIIENRNLSKQILKLESCEELVSIDKTKILVILHVKSRDEFRNWPIENWIKILENLDPLKYQIVEIGQEKCLDAKNIYFFPSTNLNQIFYLLSKGDIFIGIDSVFAHVAEIFEIPSLIIIGTLKRFAYQVPYSSYFHKNKLKYLIRKNLPIEKIEVIEVQNKLSLILKGINERQELSNSQMI